MSRGAVAALLLAGLAGLAVVGCRDQLDDHRRTGELGNDAFYYLCVDDTDVACNEGGYATFPSAIGVGGRFALQYGGFGRELGTIEPASRTFVRRDGDGFVAREPGFVAMLARDAADARVLDFVHVAVMEPSLLMLRANAHDNDAGFFRVWSVGTSVDVHAVPTTEDAVLLGGAREAYAWSVSDASVLSIEGDPQGPRARIFVLAAGAVTITARSGELIGTLEVEVDAPDAGSPPTLDAGPRTNVDDDAGRSQEDGDGGR